MIEKPNINKLPPESRKIFDEFERRERYKKEQNMPEEIERIIKLVPLGNINFKTGRAVGAGGAFRQALEKSFIFWQKTKNPSALLSHMERLKESLSGLHPEEAQKIDEIKEYLEKNLDK